MTIDRLSLGALVYDRPSTMGDIKYLISNYCVLTLRTETRIAVVRELTVAAAAISPQLCAYVKFYH